MTRYRTEMLVMASVAMAAAGQTLIKLGLTGQVGWTSMKLSWLLNMSLGVIAGLCVYGIGTLLWFAAVARQSISYVYPLAATNYVLMGLVGHFLLHEEMSLLRWGGIAIMAAGIALLSFTHEEAPA